jgi:hypothetical protein
MSSTFSAKSGSVERLKVADAVRLQAVCLPDPLHRAQGDADRPGDGAAAERGDGFVFAGRGFGLA